MDAAAQVVRCVKTGQARAAMPHPAFIWQRAVCVRLLGRGKTVPEAACLRAIARPPFTL
ncbi:hypothetical protein GCM10010359_06940 [Streptomyces morookaense]|nr:hypothetical protein GCM10010359_06940 [Streptomyces morookaense]